MLHWIEANPVASVGAISAVMFVACLALLPVVIGRLPVDALRHATRHDYRRPDDPAAWARVIARNLIGWLLVVAGVAMLVLPGQGVLTILIGAAICDFPGKRRLLGGALRRPSIFRALNRIRAARGRPPFEPADDDA